MTTFILKRRTRIAISPEQLLDYPQLGALTKDGELEVNMTVFRIRLPRELSLWNMVFDNPMLVLEAYIYSKWLKLDQTERYHLFAFQDRQGGRLGHILATNLEPKDCDFIRDYIRRAPSVALRKLIDFLQKTKQINAIGTDL
ncbi:MAG: hypothetical protein ABH863_03160 [Candidatus Micrarchaeota archaeon]